MSKPPFDFRESTISYDYDKREVEFYFTRESNYLKMMDRNPNFLSAKQLEPGFILVYPFGEVRTPEYLLRMPRNGNKA